MLPILFITATADTLPVTEYRRVSPEPQYQVACAAVPWPLPVVTVTFQRDSGKPELWDSWVPTANMLNLCARTDARPWRVCTIYADGKLVGTFMIPAAPGEPGRGGRVEEGK